MVARAHAEATWLRAGISVFFLLPWPVLEEDPSGGSHQSVCLLSPPALSTLWKCQSNLPAGNGVEEFLARPAHFPLIIVFQSPCP